MAEGTSAGLPLPEEMKEEKDLALPEVQEVPEDNEQMVVRPKERKPQHGEGSAENLEASGNGLAQTSSGN